MRRVLLVEEGGRGGLASYTTELAAALGRAGWDVHVASARDHRTAATDGVTVHALFPYLRDRGPVTRLLRRARIGRLVNGAGHALAMVAMLPLARSCDVVHVQGGEWPPLGALQALLVRALRRPLVYTPHNTFERGERSYTRCNAIIGRCATRIVVHSEYDRRTLEPRLAAKAVVIPHGEYSGLARLGGPMPDRDAARVALGAESDDLVVLLFGQLRPDKGINDLLAATAALPHVLVILAGEDLGGLQGARLAGSRLVVQAHYIEPAQAATLFAAADVVALPYARASASGVLLLAYGHARPVVAYPVGGLPEYVQQGETGWLTERPDPAALADALRAVIAAGPAERERRGEAAARLADERYGWDAIARRTAAVYDEALQGR